MRKRKRESDSFAFNASLNLSSVCLRECVLNKEFDWEVKRGFEKARECPLNGKLTILTLSLLTTPMLSIFHLMWSHLRISSTHSKVIMYHRMVVLNCFQLNGLTLGFRPQTQKLEPRLMTLVLTLGEKELNFAWIARKRELKGN